MKIDVAPEFEAVTVHIGGVLHLWIDRKRLLGVQSWVKTGRRQFFIEFKMQGGTITADYDSLAKWEAVLAGLESVLFAGTAFSKEC